MSSAIPHQEDPVREMAELTEAERDRRIALGLTWGNLVDARRRFQIIRADELAGDCS